MIAETPSQLRERLEAVVVDVVPATAYEGSTWRPYARRGVAGRDEPLTAGPPAPSEPTSHGARSRRFRLEIEAETDALADGLHGRASWGFESSATVLVWVEYSAPAARAAEVATLAISDAAQLRRAFAASKGPSSSVILARGVSVERLGGSDAAGTHQFALRFDVRYLHA